MNLAVRLKILLFRNLTAKVSSKALLNRLGEPSDATETTTVARVKATNICAYCSGSGIEVLMGQAWGRDKQDHNP